MKTSIDSLLESPYWIIDILPKQVPKDSPGQYFEIERYWLREPQLSAIKQKHIDLVLKLNCYADVSLDGWDTVDPPPERIAEEMRSRYTCVMIGDSMIVSQPDETWLTFYGEEGEIFELVKTIAAGEGLYVWRP